MEKLPESIVITINSNKDINFMKELAAYKKMSFSSLVGIAIKEFCLMRKNEIPGDYRPLENRN